LVEQGGIRPGDAGAFLLDPAGFSNVMGEKSVDLIVAMSGNHLSRLSRRKATRPRQGFIARRRSF
jgi:hypothetical protein